MLLEQVSPVSLMCLPLPFPVLHGRPHLASASLHSAEVGGSAALHWAASFLGRVFKIVRSHLHSLHEKQRGAFRRPLVIDNFSDNKIDSFPNTPLTTKGPLSGGRKAVDHLLGIRTLHSTSFLQANTAGLRLADGGTLHTKFQQ